MSEAYLGWAWPRQVAARKQHYFPQAGGGSLCGLWVAPCDDRDEKPAHPCEDCERRLVKRQAILARAAKR
jgi:hypothetical protein